MLVGNKCWRKPILVCFPILMEKDRWAVEVRRKWKKVSFLFFLMQRKALAISRSFLSSLLELSNYGRWNLLCLLSLCSGCVRVPFRCILAICGSACVAGRRMTLTKGLSRFSLSYSFCLLSVVFSLLMNKTCKARKDFLLSPSKSSLGWATSIASVLFAGPLGAE